MAPRDSRRRANTQYRTNRDQGGTGQNDSRDSAEADSMVDPLLQQEHSTSKTAGFVDRLVWRRLYWPVIASRSEPDI